MQKAGPTDSLFLGTSIWRGLKAFIFYKINEAEASIRYICQNVDTFTSKNKSQQISYSYFIFHS